MATKLKQQCGHCGKLWYKGRNTTTRLESGPPVVKCSACYKSNHTGLEWHTNMTKAKLFKAYFFGRFFIPMSLWIACAYFTYGFLNEIIYQNNWSGYGLAAATFIIGFFATLITYSNMITSMKEIEKRAIDRGIRNGVMSSNDFAQLYFPN